MTSAMVLGFSGIGGGMFLNAEAVRDLSAIASKQETISQNQIDTDKRKAAGGGILMLCGALAAAGAAYSLGEKSKNK
jgi:hypothetical protein